VRRLTLSPTAARRRGITIRQDGVRREAADLLALPDVDFSVLAGIWPELNDLAADVREQLEIDAHYAGYLDRQQADIASFRRDEALALPHDFDYATISGLSTECRTKLSRIQPRTLGQAARIEGVTPAALTLVLAHVKSRKGNLRRAG